MRAVSLLLIACASACGFDETPKTTSCVQGEASVCECTSNRSGVQRCGTEGFYEACECSAGSVSAPADLTGGSSSGSSSTGGSSGNTGSAGGGSPDAGSGEGGQGTGEAGSGTGTAGAAGTTGSAGGGAGAGGASGSGGASSGTGGESGGTGGTVEPPPPVPGSAYTRCAAMTDCEDGLYCSQGTANNRTTGYCTPMCILSGGTCPQPTSGEIEATCAPLVGLCVLQGCGEDAACPRDMECLKITGPFGGDLIAACVY